MKILTVYKALLLDVSEIRDIVGKSVFIEKIDQNTIRPNILLQMPDQGADYTHDGITSLFDAHIKVTCRADTDQMASELGELVVHNFSRFIDTVHDLKIMMTRLDSEMSNYDTSAKVFEQVSEYTSFYRKAHS